MVKQGQADLAQFRQEFYEEGMYVDSGIATPLTQKNSLKDSAESPQIVHGLW
jgi:hypothetical protein